MDHHLLEKSDAAIRECLCEHTHAREYAALRILLRDLADSLVEDGNPGLARQILACMTAAKSL